MNNASHGSRHQMCFIHVCIQGVWLLEREPSTSTMTLLFISHKPSFSSVWVWRSKDFPQAAFSAFGEFMLLFSHACKKMSTKRWIMMYFVFPSMTGYWKIISRWLLIKAHVNNFPKHSQQTGAQSYPVLLGFFGAKYPPATVNRLLCTIYSW